MEDEKISKAYHFFEQLASQHREYVEEDIEKIQKRIEFLKSYPKKKEPKELKDLLKEQQRKRKRALDYHKMTSEYLEVLEKALLLKEEPGKIDYIG